MKGSRIWSRDTSRLSARFAPPEISELDARIEGIRKNRRIDGLNRFDKRYKRKKGRYRCNA